jgi:hypothetical protein
MQGFIKTMFGDKRTVMVAVASIIIAFAALHSPATAFAGAILPLCLLAGAAYLARH